MWIQSWQHIHVRIPKLGSYSGNRFVACLQNFQPQACSKEDDNSPPILDVTSEHKHRNIKYSSF